MAKKIAPIRSEGAPFSVAKPQGKGASAFVGGDPSAPICFGREDVSEICVAIGTIQEDRLPETQ